jgi:hypothetical protein
MPAPANYSLVFADEFTGLSISNTTTATANWYTAQPWGGGFGSEHRERFRSRACLGAIVHRVTPGIICWS